MERKFSLAHLTALRCPTPELIYIAAMAGYDYVSPRLVNLGVAGEGNYDLATQPQLLAQTKRAMEATGVGIHDIELMRILDGVDLKSYEPAMEVGASLGAKHVLSSIWTSNKSYYIEKFGELCDLAAKYGLGVQLEFVTWASVSTLAQAKEVLLAVNKSNAGLMVDTLHAHRSRVKPEELEDCPPEWFQFFHMCDGPAAIPETQEELIVIGRDARRYCGEGAIDMAAYISRMPPNTTCSIELPHLANAAEFGYAEHARRCIVSAKEYLKKHNLL